MVQGLSVSHVCRSGGEKISPKHIKQTVKHSLKLIFWGCISLSGPKTLIPISGMMNRETYIPIVEKKAFQNLKS